MTSDHEIVFNLVRLSRWLMFQIDSLESRADNQSALLSGLFNILKTDEEGRQLLLKIQKDAHEILQTMNGPPDAGYEQMQAWLGNVQREMLRGTEEPIN